MTTKTRKFKPVTRELKNTDAGEHDYSKHAPDAKYAPYQGDRILNREAMPFFNIMPGWTSDRPTVILPYPAVSRSDGLPLPGRKNTGLLSPTDWFRALPAASMVGTVNKISFVRYDPRRRDRVDFADPFNMLTRAVYKNIGGRDKPIPGEAFLGERKLDLGAWKQRVFHPSDYKEAIFCNSDQQALVMQGLVFQHDKEVFVKDGKPPLGAGRQDHPVILTKASSTAVEALERLLSLQPKSAPNSTDFEQTHLAGDPVDFANGRFLAFYNPTHQPHIDWLKVAMQTPGAVNSQKITDFEDYEVKDAKARWQCAAFKEAPFMTDGSTVVAKASLEPYEDIFAERYQWFDDTIYYPSPQEVMVLLAAAFNDAMGRDMLRFAFSDRPDLLGQPEVQVIFNAAPATDQESKPSLDDEVERTIKLRRQAEEEQQPTTSAVASGLGVNLDDFDDSEGGETEEPEIDEEEDDFFKSALEAHAKTRGEKS